MFEYFLGKDQDTERLLKDLEGEDSSDVIYERVENSNDDYIIESSTAEHKIETDDTFVMEVQNSVTLSDTVN